MVTLIIHILLVLVFTWCRSRCRTFSIMTMLRASYPRIVVRFPAVTRNLFLLQSFKTGSGSSPASYRVVVPSLYPQINRHENEADHSSPPNAEFRDELRHISISLCACLTYTETNLPLLYCSCISWTYIVAFHFRICTKVNVGKNMRLN